MNGVKRRHEAAVYVRINKKLWREAKGRGMVFGLSAAEVVEAGLRAFVQSSPAPRYDDVFAEGQAWLDRLAGPAITDESTSDVERAIEDEGTNRPEQATSDEGPRGSERVMGGERTIPRKREPCVVSAPVAGGVGQVTGVYQRVESGPAVDERTIEAQRVIGTERSISTERALSSEGTNTGERVIGTERANSSERATSNEGTRRREHRLGCDEYHQHRAPYCCSPDCWCLKEVK